MQSIRLCSCFYAAFAIVVSAVAATAATDGDTSSVVRLSVAASGRVSDRMSIAQDGQAGIGKTVVRRAEKSAGTNAIVRRVKKSDSGSTVSKKTDSGSKVSTFAGLQRTDRYSFHSGLNCSSQHGAADLGKESVEPALGKSVHECQKMCAEDDDCTCITYEKKLGKCTKKTYCDPEECVASSLIDTYVQHSTFKTSKISVSVNKTGESEAAWPQFSFERSGGRLCSADVENITDVPGAGPLVYDDYSVTQCLNTCLNTTGCDCVVYERYYQSVCTLKTNCPPEGEVMCDRSIEFDMYVLKSE